MSDWNINPWIDVPVPISTSPLPKEKKGFQWDYFSKLVLLALFVSGTIIVFIGVVFELQDRIKEADKLNKIRQRRIRRRRREMKIIRTQEERLALLEEQILELEADDQIILDSATRTANFIIIALGALLQVVAYVSRFNWALNGQDSIIGMSDSRRIW